MLFDPARHEPLRASRWDPARAQAAIDWIVRATCRGGAPDRGWPTHPKDLEPGDDAGQESTTLYDGTAGVVWALRHLEAVGAVAPGTAPAVDLAALRERNRAWLHARGSSGEQDAGSYLMGELPIALMAFAEAPSAPLADRLAALIDGNLDHPARELMWGAPGSLLAASFLHERSGDARWAEAYRRTAARLEQQLHWSGEHRCHYWRQDLYGHRCSYLDAVHGFVATAHGLIRGRHLLGAGAWHHWQRRIVETVARSATREAGLANWRPELIVPPGRTPRMLMQYCHGAPGFVVCLARLPAADLDELLLEAGEAIWVAGPLTKGSNLCHGTAGNGYAFLALHERTGDELWLQRARAFAMHAIAQAEAEAATHGRLRYSLWTGDPGLAIYLWDCLRGRTAFPTLDVFYGAPSAAA